MSKLSKNLLLILFIAALVAPSAHAFQTLRQFCDDIRDDKPEMAEQIQSAFPALLDDSKGLEECLYWAVRTLNREVVQIMLSEHRRPMLEHQLRRAQALFVMMWVLPKDHWDAGIGNVCEAKDRAKAIERIMARARARTVCSLHLSWTEVARVLIQELKRARHEADDTHRYEGADFLRVIEYEAMNGAISARQLKWFMQRALDEDDLQAIHVLIRHPLVADALPALLKRAYSLDKTEITRTFWNFHLLPDGQMQKIADEDRAARQEFQTRFQAQPDWTCPTLGLAAGVPALAAFLFWYASGQ